MIGRPTIFRQWRRCDASTAFAGINLDIVRAAIGIGTDARKSVSAKIFIPDDEFHSDGLAGDAAHTIDALPKLPHIADILVPVRVDAVPALRNAADGGDFRGNLGAG